MSGYIFINYRRDDTGNAAGRLYDHLEDHFGSHRLFIDVDKIAGGLDFISELDLNLAKTDVLLAVVGSDWISITDTKTGKRRLDNPSDFVRLEIETALKKGLEIIPVLVDGVPMPSADELPDSLKAFCRCNALRLTLERFRSDVKGIIDNIEEALERVTKRRQLEKKKIEEVKAKEREIEKKRNREEAIRQSLANLTPEQIKNAEALANWDYIKDSSDASDFHQHLEIYPDHFVTKNLVLLKLEGIEKSNQSDIPNLQLRSKKHSELFTSPNNKMTDVKDHFVWEEEAWEQIKSTDEVKLVEKFLNDFPGGAKRKEALRLLKKLSARKEKKQSRTLTLTTHSNSVNCVVFSPDGSKLASSAADNTVKIWDTRSGNELLTICETPFWGFLKRFNEVRSIKCVAFSPDGKTIASTSDDHKQDNHTIWLWDVKTGRKIDGLKGATYAFNSICFSPDGHKLASGSRSGDILIWDVNTRIQIGALKGHSHHVDSVIFSSEGNLLASCSVDRTVRLWDMKTGKQIVSLERSISFAVDSFSPECLAFSPDGQFLAVGDLNNNIQIWDLQTLKQVKKIKAHDESVTSVAFSPDSKVLISSSLDWTIKLWDVSTWKEIIQLKGHTDPVYTVCFSPNGKQIASGSADNTIKIWNAPWEPNELES